MRALLPALACLLLCARPLSAAPPVTSDGSSENVKKRLEQAADAISELRLADAERIITEIAKTDPELPALLMASAHLHFYRGEYTKAVALADRALTCLSCVRAKSSWHQSRKLMANTAEATRDFQSTSSSDGRYVVSWSGDKDTLLAEYAIEVLALADQALQRIFDTALPYPIRLEIYASPESLAQVSALTPEQIKTTGTVALSKWNRLMVTSPKALVRGYPWADTITHELIHMVVSRSTGDHAPVWLQEGIAKLFERAWRQQNTTLMLDAGAETLLREAASRKKLLTFEAMHPSIAMLPTEEDAALAFAEVSTFMQRYVEKYGQGALRDALAQIEGGTDARAALAKAAKQSFAALESSWKQSIPAAKGADSGRRLRTRFATNEGVTDDSTDVVIDKARRHMRVGDLLWDRGRTAGAAKEYAKAQQADPSDPIVATRWARAALQANDPRAAVAALAPQIQRYPAHAPAHAMLGAAHLQLGQRSEASTALREAIWINPFDPGPHCDLAKASDNPSEIEREERNCERLR